MWEKLADCTAPYFREGVLIKFKTISSPGNDYRYALGFRMDFGEDISFVGFDGITWGYGRCTLPPEARFEGKPYTVSRTWLVHNFIHIAEPEDIDDIWICEKALPLLESLSS